MEGGGMGVFDGGGIGVRLGAGVEVGIMGGGANVGGRTDVGSTPGGVNWIGVGSSGLPDVAVTNDGTVSVTVGVTLGSRVCAVAVGVRVVRMADGDCGATLHNTNPIQ